LEEYKITKDQIETIVNAGYRVWDHLNGKEIDLEPVFYIEEIQNTLVDVLQKPLDR
jgi:hypothetical protein